MFKISALGPKGTFSSLATEKYMENQVFEISYFPTLELTMNALQSLDFAIVPVENTLDGFIQQTLDLILEKNAFVIDEIYIPVQFSFIGRINSLSDVKRIYGQFAANGQCQKFLNQLNSYKMNITDSNMESFELLNQGIFGDASIVPNHIAKNYSGFKIDNITDSKENYTRFFIVSKNETSKIIDDMKVFIVVIPVEDRPGLLFDILGIFKTYDINLTSIMSRPTKTKIGQYNFYIEMQSNIKNRDTIDLVLSEIKKDFSIKLLGIYPTNSY